MGVFTQDRSSYFLDQSVRDSPCRVRLAGSEALFSLSKWGGEASLVFAPGGEHEGKIEIARNELFLKPSVTPKAQHVFRKLDGDRFEYDVVLLKEPESNVIEIDLDFPDGLEFYRQPTLDEVTRQHVACAPEVIECYAVYWKEANNRYKTGKFCHIYRPLIYDPRGRKVWGGLDLCGKKLTITIPEGWLADASYPVVVDPIIGTQTVGASKQIDWWAEDNPGDFYIELGMAVTKFMVSSTPIQGFCRAHLYSYLSGDYAAQPVVYSDSGGKPYERESQQETVVSCSVSTPGWVESSFIAFPGIQSYTPFWFGFNTPGIFYTYFDYASTMYRMDTENLTAVPTTFTDSFSQSWNVKMSAYFEYALPQAYQRTVAASVGVGGSSPVKRMSLGRLCSDALQALESLGLVGTFFRWCTSGAVVRDGIGSAVAFVCRCASEVAGSMNVVRRLSVIRSLASGFEVFEALRRRLCLMKDEVVIVSRVTREIEFRGYLV